MFDIEFSRKAVKYLRKSGDANRILAKIELLKEAPVLHDSKKIVDEDKTYRIRAGDHRILYTVNWQDNVVLISKIDKRERAYNR